MLLVSLADLPTKLFPKGKYFAKGDRLDLADRGGRVRFYILVLVFSAKILYNIRETTDTA
jgi:hypothetical protein